jgi:hypothetical protein
MVDSLFEPLGDDRYLPTSASVVPWSQAALHGGAPSALLAGAAERLLDDLQPARVSIELLRPVPVAPLTVSVRAVRPGRKVRLVAGELASEDGTVVATVTLLGIRRADVAVPASAADDAAPPGPDTVASASRDDVGVGAGWDGFHNTGVEHRFVVGGFHERGPSTDWIRLRVPVVPGQAPTPLQRVMAAADFGNGISAVADFSELLFINPDLTVHLHRLPEGEWVALEAQSRLGPNGVGLAQSDLWDERGRLGRSLQSLLLEAR